MIFVTAQLRPARLRAAPIFENQNQNHIFALLYTICIIYIAYATISPIRDHVKKEPINASSLFIFFQNMAPWGLRFCRLQTNFSASYF